MKDQGKTKQVLIQELASLRQSIAQLEKSESERKRAEETLRESKERYNTIFDRSLDCIYVVDFDGNFIDANPAALTLLGYERTDIRSLNIVSLLDEKDLSKGLQDFSEIIQVGFQKEVGEYRLRCKDGRCITVETQASVVYHDDKPRSVTGIARDITNRKQVEKALKESSGKYKELSTLLESLFNAIPDVLGIQDHQHGIIRYNQAGYDFLGRTQQEVEGKKCFQLINRTKPCEICATSEVYRTKKPARVEKYIEEMGVWLDCRSYPVFDEDGNLSKIIEHLRDITEHKQAENALKKNEERLRLITDNMSDMIRVTDLKGVNVFSSPSHFKGLGYRPEERVGKSAFDIVHPDDMEKVIKAFSEGIPAKRRTTVEYRVRHADGHYVWIETVGDGLWNAQGDITAVVMSSRDVSERKRAAEALRESEEKYRVLVEAAGEAIFIVQDGIIKFCNKNFSDISGYELADLANMAFSDLVHPDDLQMVFDRYIQRLEGKDVLSRYRFRFVDARGNARWADMSVALISWEGKQASLCLAADVTELKQAEEALLLRDRAIASSINAIVISDLNGSITYVNDAFTRMWGYTTAEASGMPVTRLGSSDEEVEKFVSQFRIHGHAIGESIAKRKDGYLFHIQVSGSLVFDETGQPKAMLASFIDITNRKRAEEELRESEERYRNFVRNATEGIYRIDFLPPVPLDLPERELVECLAQNAVVGEVNEYLARMYGLSATDMIGRRATDFAPTYGARALLALRAPNFQVRDQETDDVNPNGQTVSLLENFTGVVEDGQLIHIWGMQRDITDRKRTEAELQRTLERLKNAVNTTIQVMVSAVEVRDPYTSGHQIRSANLARVIATEMGLPPNIIDGIRMAGSIHDIGKLSIPAEILSKPTRLTNIEFSLIKEHSRSGYEMLKDVESPWPLAEIVYQHHERMDGSGYPRNLKGDEIIMEARIMAVADVVESMASHRPYRPALGIEEALDEIEKNRGTHYDSAVADACLKLFREKGYQLEKT